MIHLHKWGRWESASWTIFVQYRACEVCGKRKIRYA